MKSRYRSLRAAAMLLGKRRIKRQHGLLKWHGNDELLRLEDAHLPLRPRGSMERMRPPECRIFVARVPMAIRPPWAVISSAVFSHICPGPSRG